MKRFFVVTLVLLSSVFAKAENEVSNHDPAVERMKVYDAVLTLIKAKAIKADNQDLKLDENLVEDLIQNGILKPGGSAVSSICTDIIQ